MLLHVARCLCLQKLSQHRLHGSSIDLGVAFVHQLGPALAGASGPRPFLTRFLFFGTRCRRRFLVSCAGDLSFEPLHGSLRLAQGRLARSVVLCQLEVFFKEQLMGQLHLFHLLAQLSHGARFELRNSLSCRFTSRTHCSILVIIDNDVVIL